VANVSHELKTPMGALGLLAETLISEPDPDVAQRLAGRIHNEAFRVSRIIDDLLDLSRIESEEAPAREPVLVNLVMADAIERVRATADQRGIALILHEPSPPVAVLGERRQLVSAMHALLENAITYSYDNSKVVISGTIRRASSEAAASFTTGSTPIITSDVAPPAPPALPAHAAPAQPDDTDPGPFDGETAAISTADLDAFTSAPAPGAAAPAFPETTFSDVATSSTAPAAPDSESAAEGGDDGSAGRSEWHPEDHDTVRLSVQDHGIGIPARDLDRIFERFYRVDHGRSRDTGGTGLGLSIVRHVANNHQGWVDVESREGEGSTFSLVLPIQAERMA
jgi:signal transduction histidine kinase